MTSRERAEECYRRMFPVPPDRSQILAEMLDLRADALALAEAVEHFEAKMGDHTTACPYDSELPSDCTCGYQVMMHRAGALRERWGRG